MTATTHDRPTSDASNAYLLAVGAALAGISESDRQELLDDLAEHLAELGTENEAGLVERLGAPELYAAELLASAGIVTSAKNGWSRSRLVERARAVSARFDSARAERLQAFLVDLRPGWWVVRGWLVVAALAAREGLQEALWIPNLTQNVILNIALLGGAIALSVWVGRGPTWGAWLASALGALALLSVVTADRSSYYAGADQSYAEKPGVLMQLGGPPVSNVFAYDASGKPVRVFLFDQGGAPLDVGNADIFQAAGLPFVSGLFPQPTIVWNDAGRARAVQPEPPIVAIPRLPQPSPAKAKAEATTTVPKTQKPTGASGATGGVTPQS